MATTRRPISYATRQWVKERDKYRCVDCNTHENLTVDHIIPVVKGGTNDVSNLTTRCQSCNSRKGANVPTEPSGRPAAQGPDRLSAVVELGFDPRSLVGSFFHSDQRRGWQGCVLAEVAPQVYLVELFEWMMGSSSAQKLVPLADMMEWSFYDTSEWLQNSSDDVQRRWERERAQNGNVPA